MFAGFDYGSSNCAVGVMDQGAVKLLPLWGEQRFAPSTLYAADRGLICESVAHNIESDACREAYVQQRAAAIQRASQIRRNLNIGEQDNILFVGEEAIDNYINFPEEGYFVKSPKSFLGVSGLRQEQIAFFEDIVTAMMQSIKRQAETSLQKSITQTVIGRPVNFQGSGGEKSNQQAIEILTTAAQRAGYQQVEFLYEPLAAGIDFETNMQQDQVVLVVDIGGGTTDCSVVRMGPSHRIKANREDDFLGHSGQRVGGNDLDIHLSYKAFMPLLGLGSSLKSGLVMPSEPYWNAVRTNDVNAQMEFSSRANVELLAQLCRDASNPALVKRLLDLQQHKTNHQLVRCGEQSKIELSDSLEISKALGFIEQGLTQPVTRALFAEAIQGPLNRISALMKEAVTQAQCSPDLVYVTGGTAKSPVIRDAIQQQLGEIPIMDGDHFGSVTAGLTKWAEKLFG
ncbi:molecular chaperone [Alkalimarinus alittae]|uniref:Molecular chaperone n=1 Tax=Alkalimarinus alittae TaxID=2961619 RepID=A0ABY6N2P7_9ALTE|nr:molecular chaperone [Alkalimarinus alittae]UZE96373.1 molecular chaperone [Alkalimarinus alittae]